VPEPTTDQILDALRQVIDPDLGKDIVTLGFITSNVVKDGCAEVTVNLTTPACPMKNLMREQAEKAILAVPGITEVKVEMTAEVKSAPRKAGDNLDIKHFIAVSSGKGGVGKTTTTVNLACALAATGARVGILDCDVYGPDIPMMMGLEGRPETAGSKLVPHERFGVKTMSIGFLLEEDMPVMWRGPMIHKLLEQFLQDVEWGELDYLLVDMPPGTGDAQISLAQIVPLSGAVLVTTPQAVSTADVNKAILMFKEVNVDVLGVIENMSGLPIVGQVDGARAGTKVKIDIGHFTDDLEIDKNGKFTTVLDIFGAGGAEFLAKKYDIPVLGRVPIDPSVHVSGDGGTPPVVSTPDSLTAERFGEIAGKLAQRLAVKQFSLPVLQ
jgi:ATP-binding protein involved in chromosome partitioning